MTALLEYLNLLLQGIASPCQHCLCALSRHTVVCHAAQENGAHANYVSILTGTTKSRFSPIYNSVVFYLINPKVAVDVPAYQRRLHTKFEKKSREAFSRYK